MRKNSIFSVLLTSVTLAAAVLPTVSCKSNFEGNVEFSPTVTIAQAEGSAKYTPIIDGLPGNKTEIALLSGDIYTVCKYYRKMFSESFNFYYEDCFAPTPLTVSWTSKEDAPLYYTFDISTNSDMSSAESYVTFENSVTLNYLFMGYDYYYQISAKYEDKLIKSRIFEFSTEYLPRTVFVDENVSNTRDLGGYYVENGTKRVKQGIVYRGGALEEISEAGKRTMLVDLGIKTDLDLRKDGSSNLGHSPISPDLNYVEVGGPWYVGQYGNGIDMPSYRDALLTEIRVFANADNFPVYVHCSLGRDRTGTICFLINALLGVGEQDLFRDYEISSMARTGKSKDSPNSEPSYMTGVVFQYLYDYIKNFQPGKTLQENAEAFMLSIGITESEISAIRENMLEDVR